MGFVFQDQRSFSSVRASNRSVSRPGRKGDRASTKPIGAQKKAEPEGSASWIIYVPDNPFYRELVI